MELLLVASKAEGLAQLRDLISLRFNLC